MSSEFDPTAQVLFEKDESEGFDAVSSQGAHASSHTALLKEDAEYQLWQIEVETPGFFVITDSWFPTWTASINGVPTPILKAYGLFRAVWIPSAGPYKVEFRNRPF